MRTGLFVGGKNAILALDMLSAAKKALMPPFGISLFADPAVRFTTAAAMVACVEKTLRDKKQRSLKGLRSRSSARPAWSGFLRRHRRNGRRRRHARGLRRRRA